MQADESRLFQLNRGHAQSLPSLPTIHGGTATSTPVLVRRHREKAFTYVDIFDSTFRRRSVTRCFKKTYSWMSRPSLETVLLSLAMKESGQSLSSTGDDYDFAPPGGLRRASMNVC